MKILVSAYACFPPTTESCTEEEKKMADGEALLGWNLINQVVRAHDVWVITQARNKRGIERAMRNHALNKVTFIYCDFPGWPEKLWDVQIFNHLYYYFWQIMAYYRARHLNLRIHFDLAHHITFANDWMPSFIGAFLPVPFIWGPIGGGHQTPKALMIDYNFSQKMDEYFRMISQWIGRHLLISRRLCQIKARAILVCNYETRDRIPAKWRNKLHMFPVNSLSPEDFQAESQELPEGREFRILSVGRLRPLKGFALAMKAFAEFIKGCPEATLEIIGDGSEKDRLKELARNLHIEDQVLFSPWLPRNEVLRRMRRSHVFLFPSFREGGGAVIIEAMAKAKPVIVIDSGGPAFHVQPEWGFKIVPQNYKQVLGDIVRALTKLREDKYLRRQLGEAAFTRAKEFYLLDRLGEYLEKIYHIGLS